MLLVLFKKKLALCVFAIIDNSAIVNCSEKNIPLKSKQSALLMYVRAQEDFLNVKKIE